MDSGIAVTLGERRNLVEMTLRYVESERRGVDEIAECLDKAAYQRRGRLLDGVIGWYREELKEIEHSLAEAKTACSHL